LLYNLRITKGVSYGQAKRGPARRTVRRKTPTIHKRTRNTQLAPSPTISEAVNYLVWNGWLLFSDFSALWRGSGELTFIRPKQYLRILCEEKHPRYVNGKEIPNWQQGPTVSEAVLYLSRKGWLLFSDHSALQLGYGELTLIRPKQ